MATLILEDIPPDLMEKLEHLARQRKQTVTDTIRDVLILQLGQDQVAPDIVVPCNLPRPAGGPTVRVKFGGKRMPTRTVFDEQTPE